MRQIRKTLIIAAISLCVTVIVCTVFFAYLPTHIEKSLLPRIAQDNNLPLTLEVRRVWLTAADFSNVAIRTDSETLLHADSIRLDYSPLGIVRKRIDRISVTGVNFSARLKEGKLVMPLLPATTNGRAGPEKTQDEGQTIPINLPFAFKEIKITHADITVFSEGKSFRVPCNLVITAKDDPVKNIECRLFLLLGNQPLTITATLNLEKGDMVADMSMLDADLRRLSGLLMTEDALPLAGRVDLAANAHLELSPLRLLSGGLTCMFEQGGANIKGVQIRNVKDKQGKTIPFMIKTDADNEVFKITSSSFAVAGPVAFEAGGLDLTVGPTEEGGYAASGVFALKGGEERHREPSEVPLSIDPFNLVMRVKGALDRSGSWQFDIRQDSKDTPIRIAKGPATVISKIAECTIEGAVGGDGSSLSYKIALADLNVESGDFSLTVPRFFVFGKFDNGVIDSSATIDDGSFSMAGTGINGKGIEGKIPFRWPYVSDSRGGRAQVENIRWDGKELGNLVLKFRQTEEGYKITGSHESKLVNGFCIAVNGFADFFSEQGVTARLTFADSCKKTLTVDLGDIAPQISGYSAAADLSLNGEITYDASGIKGSAVSRLRNIKLTSDDEVLLVTGGTLDLQFLDLFRLRSGPRQSITFKRAQLGSIIAEEGLIEFQIESPLAVFIEKSSVRWCDGHVYTPAMRFSPKMNSFDITFFCDRLSLARVFDQFGVATAEGKGRVNGRIPVRLSNGNISFHDGFLYSTPGEGGTIRLKEADFFTAGIPAHTPQFTQVELAQEALKDFTYNWAKLDINTEGEDLLMHMQVNGKPAKVLPFVYKKEFGGFARVEAGSPGSRFQGIKLDVNFRLPLNQILYYGLSIKEAIE